MGPREPRGHGHAAHPAAGRRRRRAHAGAHGRVPRRHGRDRAGLRAGVRLRPRRRPSGRWSTTTGHAADATGAGVTIRLRDRPGARHRGRPRARPPRAAARASGPTARCRGPRSWPSPADVDDADGAHRRHDARSGARWLAGARIPDHRWREPIQRSALAIKGLTYMPTGATVAALTTSLPETPGGERNWDYRYTWMRDSTFTLQALHWLNLDWEADEFMQFVADLEPNEDGALQIMYGIDGRRDLTESTRDDLSGYAGARPGADRQRRLRPAPERRVRRRARLDPAAHPAQPAAAAAAVADRAGPGRVRDRGLARARPGHLGGARRAAALRVVEADVLGGARPRRQAGRDPRRPRAGRRRGGRPPRRSRPTSSSTASSERRRAAPALRHRRARRLDAAGGRSSASCPATTSGCTQACWRSPTS